MGGGRTYKKDLKYSSGLLWIKKDLYLCIAYGLLRQTKDSKAKFCVQETVLLLKNTSRSGIHYNEIHQLTKIVLLKYPINNLMNFLNKNYTKP